MDHLNELTGKLQKIRQEIDKMPKSKHHYIEVRVLDDVEQFKDQKLPLARIKKIMKSDEDVRVSLIYHISLVIP